MGFSFQNHGEIFECKRSHYTTEITRGIIVKMSHNLIMLNKFVDAFFPDGYIILQKKDITEYRFFDNAKCFEKRVQQQLSLNGMPFPEEIDLSSMANLLHSLLKKDILFSFEKEKSYNNILWLGKLQHLTSSCLYIKELDAEAIWGPISRHLIRSITKIEFGNRYINLYNILGKGTYSITS